MEVGLHGAYGTAQHLRRLLFAESCLQPPHAAARSRVDDRTVFERGCASFHEGSRRELFGGRCGAESKQTLLASDLESLAVGDSKRPHSHSGRVAKSTDIAADVDQRLLRRG